MHGAHYANNLYLAAQTALAELSLLPVHSQDWSGLQLPTHSPVFFLQALESLYLSTSCKQLSSLQNCLKVILALKMFKVNFYFSIRNARKKESIAC